MNRISMASIIIYPVERRRLFSITFEHKGVRCQFYSSKQPRGEASIFWAGNPYIRYESQRVDI